MQFKAVASREQARALLLTGALATVGLTSGVGSMMLSFNLPSFILLLLGLALLGAAGWVLYHALACWTLRYGVDRNRLVIEWLWGRYIIPIHSIERLVITRSGMEPGPRRRWPALYMPDVFSVNRRRSLTFAAADASPHLTVVTPVATVHLAPEDLDGLIEAVQERYRLGPTQVIRQRLELVRLLRWGGWRDRLAMGLLLMGALGLLILLVWLSLVYPRLPDSLALHFDAQGMPDRFGPRSRVFTLPVVALLSLIANGALGALIYERQPVGTYLLWAGTLIVEVLVGLALGTVIP